ncbi:MULTISPECIES: CocE/NonD family hydrolase [Microbulbifer]|uniref:CocE/NonD family hydrolase n=1 Tax=Microbulbifer TaxID=48073 RepID=UPI001E403582|nr:MULTISPECIES: CocE/NonD family hydrolase [Microbulbifer]UHQ55569.1 CocE/NonD family hydrolase [Microbulbifer sp. YPW16]
MRVVTEFPCKITAIEHIEIPLADGGWLAARIWMPEDAPQRPVPAIMEYIPYRKRDKTRLRDSIMHPYYAGHGYACVRVDLRGSGESSGVMIDQYREQELSDAVEAIDWIARQPWCDGSVGMQGISWGGFNALQVAARRPGPLRAIVSCCSTDDLYVDNMHYMGGCLLTDNLSEATTMFSINTCPPDPELVGDRWRDMWLERLRGSGLWLDIWLRHQYRDGYWEHGSVSENYHAIQVPTMLVGGWADGYTNAIFRLLQHLQGPRMALIGPWGHKYPHQGIPGPAIDFLGEALRWWDQWLKGEETGITREPTLRAWMQDSVPPTTYYWQRPGRWVGEDSWPSDNIIERVYDLSAYRILFGNEPPCVMENVLSVQSPLSVGLFAGKWCSYTAAPDLPHDQRQEDGGALVFQSAPLQDDIEILGAPRMEIELSSSQPMAMVAVRLSDVNPNGAATRVTYGLFNLAHRHGHDKPAELVPGMKYRINVAMNHVAQVFPKGHRLRVSVSTSYWALAWPPPRPVRLDIYCSSSNLVLPLRKPRASDADIQFDEPVGAKPEQSEYIKSPHNNWLVHSDLAEDIWTLEVIKDDGLIRIDEIDLEFASRIWNWYTFQENDFNSLKGETRTERTFSRGDWSVRTTTRTVLTADADFFYIHAQLDAWEGDGRVYAENWQRKIPRDFL